MRGRIQAPGDAAHSVALGNNHGLRGFIAGSGLRADVVSRGQPKSLTVPEGGMVSGMIIGVAAQNIEDQPRIEFPQSGGGIGKAVADDFRELRVARIAGHHFIQPENGERGDHGLAPPAGGCWYPVESLDQQHILVHGLSQEHGRHIESDLIRQAHGDIFGLYNAVKIGG